MEEEGLFKANAVNEVYIAGRCLFFLRDSVEGRWLAGEWRGRFIQSDIQRHSYEGREGEREPRKEPGLKSAFRSMSKEEEDLFNHASHNEAYSGRHGAAQA